MKVHFLTIVLDGMPWLPAQFAMMNRLGVDWHWHIVEGVAKPTNCTSWCQSIIPRLSIDGTTEFVDSLKSHPRVSVFQKPLWDGKIEMVNAPLFDAKGDGLLWQIDSDEIWTEQQVEKVVSMFKDNPHKMHAQFMCRYFVGPNIITTTSGCYGNRFEYEWYRVWRWTHGRKFTRHEPPMMGGEFNESNKFSVFDTHAAGLVFDHYAYVTAEQVAFKEEYYGYKGAIEAWRALQQNEKWPVSLRQFLPWVKDQAEADLLWKQPSSKK